MAKGAKPLLPLWNKTATEFCSAGAVLCVNATRSDKDEYYGMFEPKRC